MSIFQVMTSDELKDKYALVKRYKSELKNEEMALVLLKKLKQSQTAVREGTVVGGGATLTPAGGLTGVKAGLGKDKSYTKQNSINNDLLANVSFKPK